MESIDKFCADYKAVYGNFPSKGHDPTDLQLLAVSNPLPANPVPHLDFSLFRANTIRQPNKLQYVSYSWSLAYNTFNKSLQHGPLDFAAWWKCWFACFVS